MLAARRMLEVKGGQRVAIVTTTQLRRNTHGFHARKSGIIASVCGIGRMVRIDSRGTVLAVKMSWRAERFCNGLELCFRLPEDENRGRNNE
jgi:hypothetical protein